MKVLGYPALTVDRYRELFTRPVHSFYEHHIGRSLTQAEWETFNKSFHDLYRSRVLHAGLNEHALETLATLKSYGVTQSLLSMWYASELLPLVEELGLTNHFTIIEGLTQPDSGSKLPYLVKHIASIPAPPEQILVVGDTVDDAASATAAGCPCVLHDGGIQSSAALTGTGVPVVSTLKDVATLIRRWNLFEDNSTSDSRTKP